MKKTLKMSLVKFHKIASNIKPDKNLIIKMIKRILIKKIKIKMKKKKILLPQILIKPK
jgi:hypothetical protein